MADIRNIKDKQNDKLKGKSDKEKALAAARRTMEEMRRHRHIKEPDQLASGKSDENGSMVTEDLTPDEGIDTGSGKPKEPKND